MGSETVVFDLREFQARFPEFRETIGLEGHFETATLLIGNSPAAAIQSTEKRKKILYLATAHVATLMGRGAEITGQATSTSEGSISAGFAPLEGGRAAFWEQTQYGALVWQATKARRSFIYV
jgi:hypothetical protein